MIGDAIRLEVRLRSRIGRADLSTDTLQNPDILTKLLTAGQEAVKAELGEGYAVALDVRSEAELLYRVIGYQRVAGGVFSAPGVELETKILKTLHRLSDAVERVAGNAIGELISASCDWHPGPGLRLPESTAVAGTAAELSQRIQAAREVQQRVVVLGVIGGLLALLCFVGAVLALIFLDPESRVIALGPGIYAAALAAWVPMARIRHRRAEQEIQDLRDQQDLADLMQEPLERRAQKLFQVHSHQLRRYYDQALRQRGLIFVTGLLCIAAGFGVISVAFSLIDGATETTDKIVLAALGAIGGVLGNFIAVVYLRMFTETVKSIGSFHDRLVVTHHLHFANFLAAKVGEQELRDHTLAALAQAMGSAASHEQRHAADGMGEGDRSSDTSARVS